MTIQSVNPATGAVVETFTAMDDHAIDEALQRAAAAFDRYRFIPIADRAQKMEETASTLDAEKQFFARVMTEEMGKTLNSAVAEVDKCAWVCRYYAEHAEAFLADDVVAAFDHASPTIQRIFGTPERFGEMVQQGYPMVWRPAEVTFLSTEERGGRLFQNVMVRDGAGALHILEYEMTEGASGWKIDGVRLRAPAAGAA